MAKHLRTKWIYLAGLMFVCGVLFLLFDWRSAPPSAPIIFLSKPYRMPAQPFLTLERWIPVTPSWSWLWRLKDTVFGRRKAVDLQVSIIELSDSPQSVLSQFSLAHSPDGQSNGVRVWLVTNAELDELRRQLKKDEANHLVNAPRISTADEIDAALYSGETIMLNGSTNSVGLSIRVFPQVHRESTDLSTSIGFSQVVTNSSLSDAGVSSTPEVSIRTNLDIGARFQIRDPGGIFLVETRLDGTHTNSTAVILLIKLPGRKK